VGVLGDGDLLHPTVTFFITVMPGMLYDNLGTFTPDVLLRLTD
jgi:hypothetical protein